MLLAFIIVLVAVYLLQQQRPYDSITRKEMDALLKQGRERERREWEERRNQSAPADKNEQTIPLSELEKQELLHATLVKRETLRAQWVNDLQSRHDRGLLTDRQFEEEMNRFLDSMNQ